MQRGNSSKVPRWQCCVEGGRSTPKISNEQWRNQCEERTNTNCSRVPRGQLMPINATFVDSSRKSARCLRSEVPYYCSGNPQDQTRISGDISKNQSPSPTEIKVTFCYNRNLSSSGRQDKTKHCEYDVRNRSYELRDCDKNKSCLNPNHSKVFSRVSRRSRSEIPVAFTTYKQNDRSSRANISICEPCEDSDYSVQESVHRRHQHAVSTRTARVSGKNSDLKWQRDEKKTEDNTNLRRTRSDAPMSHQDRRQSRSTLQQRSSIPNVNSERKKSDRYYSKNEPNQKKTRGSSYANESRETVYRKQRIADTTNERQPRAGSQKRVSRREDPTYWTEGDKTLYPPHFGNRSQSTNGVYVPSYYPSSRKTYSNEDLRINSSQFSCNNTSNKEPQPRWSLGISPDTDELESPVCHHDSRMHCKNKLLPCPREDRLEGSAGKKNVSPVIRRSNSCTNATHDRQPLEHESKHDESCKRSFSDDDQRCFNKHRCNCCSYPECESPSPRCSSVLSSKIGKPITAYKSCTSVEQDVLNFFYKRLLSESEKYKSCSPEKSYNSHRDNGDGQIQGENKQNHHHERPNKGYPSENTEEMVDKGLQFKKDPSSSRSGNHDELTFYAVSPNEVKSQKSSHQSKSHKSLNSTDANNYPDETSSHKNRTERYSNAFSEPQQLSTKRNKPNSLSFVTNQKHNHSTKERKPGLSVYDPKAQNPCKDKSQTLCDCCHDNDLKPQEDRCLLTSSKAKKEDKCNKYSTSNTSPIRGLRKSYAPVAKGKKDVRPYTYETTNRRSRTPGEAWVKPSKFSGYGLTADGVVVPPGVQQVKGIMKLRNDRQSHQGLRQSRSLFRKSKQYISRYSCAVLQSAPPPYSTEAQLRRESKSPVRQSRMHDNRVSSPVKSSIFSLQGSHGLIRASLSPTAIREMAEERENEPTLSPFGISKIDIPDDFDKKRESFSHFSLDMDKQHDQRLELDNNTDPENKNNMDLQNAVWKTAEPGGRYYYIGGSRESKHQQGRASTCDKRQSVKSDESGGGMCTDGQRSYVPGGSILRKMSDQSSGRRNSPKRQSIKFKEPDVNKGTTSFSDQRFRPSSYAGASGSRLDIQNGKERGRSSVRTFPSKRQSFSFDEISETGAMNKDGVRSASLGGLISKNERGSTLYRKSNIDADNPIQFSTTPAYSKLNIDKSMSRGSKGCTSCAREIYERKKILDASKARRESEKKDSRLSCEGIPEGWRNSCIGANLSLNSNTAASTKNIRSVTQRSYGLGSKMNRILLCKHSRQSFPNRESKLRNSGVYDKWLSSEW